MSGNFFWVIIYFNNVSSINCAHWCSIDCTALHPSTGHT